MILQGEIWWVDLGEPIGSEAGYRRPVAIVQNDAINQSRARTVICVPLTSNVYRAIIPGNVLLAANATGLDKDSVAITTLVVAVNKFALVEQVGKISQRQLQRIFAGLDIVLGR